MITPAFAALLACSPVLLKAQLYVGPGSSLYIPAGNVLQVDSLTLIPSSTLQLVGNSISRSNISEWAPGAGHATILQVYSIDTPLNFAGTASITYSDAGLNGNTAAALTLLHAAELTDTLRFASGNLVNTTSRTVTASFGGPRRIARFSAASSAVPLPLHILSFEARKDGPQRARLDWEASKLRPGEMFIIQRSADGIAFNDLIRVPVRAGAAAYLEFDENPLPGLNVYRLASMDLAGEVVYHGVRSLAFAAAPLTIVAWPVPAGDALHVVFSSPPSPDCRLLLSDAAGRLVMSLAAEAQQIDIPLHALSAGVYLLRSTTPGTETLRILKQ